jgi:asparagine synthase (glutamine-hydrolysing)
MCGIAGWFAGGDRCLPAHDYLDCLARMHGALRHRGPDDSGQWVAPDRAAALVHTRLAILDLSSAGRQPMHSPDSRYTIVFNGEIFNFRELKSRLEVGGTRFVTATDTEVILRLYEREGADCVRQLRGMYALAIWDGQARRGFLARDPLGIKPLYYCEMNGQLLFASELRSLLASGIVPRVLDPHSLARYFETGSVPEPGSLVRSVSMLPAGHTLDWEGGRSRLARFWRIEFPEPDRSRGAREWIGRTRAALEDTVRAHFVSDVPVGVFLSGGVDSTAIVALARATGQGEDLRTYSIGVDDAQLDESLAAEEIARHFGTRHTTFHVDAGAANDAFAGFLQAMDSPSIDGFNTWLVSRLARREGAKVVLSGLGGDELFGGYPSFVRVPRLSHLATAIATAGPLGRKGGDLLAGRSDSPRWQRLGNLLAGPPSLLRAYKAFRGVFAARDARQLSAHFAGVSAAEIPDADEDARAELPRDPRDAVCYLELSRYMRCQLLRDSDVMSMAHGLELRVPFVDRILFESIRPAPASIRLRLRKRLLLDAMPEIPHSVRQRRKKGFTLPFAAWLRGGIADEINAMRETLPVTAESWYQRWSIYCFRRWWERIGQSCPA